MKPDVTFEPTAMQFVGSAIFNAIHSLSPEAALSIIVEAARLAETPNQFDTAISAGIMLMEISSLNNPNRI